MKFPVFEYIRANSVAEAVQLLARYGSDGRVLAGGQSLLPMLAFRMSSPAVLIDIGGIADLKVIDQQRDFVRIGALVRHVDLEFSEVIASRLPLIARVMPEIAHSAIRNRGTLGGSLALADPAAQLPACMVALDAVMVAQGPKGERQIAASDFFVGTYETSLAAGEILTHIDIPIPLSGTGVFFAQLSRRHGDFALVGLAAVTLVQSDGSQELRLVFLGCGDRPIRARRTEDLLRHMRIPPERAELVARLETDLEPSTDLQATEEMRIHLAAVLVERAVSELANQ